MDSGFARVENTPGQMFERRQDVHADQGDPTPQLSVVMWVSETEAGGYPQVCRPHKGKMKSTRQHKADPNNEGRGVGCHLPA